MLLSMITTTIMLMMMMMVMVQRRRWIKEELDANSAVLGLKYKYDRGWLHTLSFQLGSVPHPVECTVCRDRLVFIESICNDEKVIAANVRETKLKSPDYQHEDETFAVTDFLKRIEHYVAAYETLDDVEDMSYIKLIDAGRKLITNRLSGYLNGRILFFLQNLNISPRPIWLSRHGESQNNALVCHSDTHAHTVTGAHAHIRSRAYQTCYFADLLSHARALDMC